MKSRTLLASAAALGLAALASMQESYSQFVRRPIAERRYRPHKEAKARPVNNPAGSKTFSLGKSINGVTFSPKKDIGKGPRFTRSVRGFTAGYAGGNGH